MNIIYVKNMLEICAIVAGLTVTLIPTYRWMKNRIRRNEEEEEAKEDERKTHKAISEQTLESIKGIDIRLKNVEEEITLSDGSIKNFVHVIKAEIDTSNWLNPRPMFRTTTSGLNIFVNEAYCQICKCKSEDLINLGWMNFLISTEMADSIHRRWMSFAHELTQYNDVMHFVTNDGEDRGNWNVVIKPLGPTTLQKNVLSDDRTIIKEDVHEYIWHGTFKPKDDIAKKIADNLGIPY